MNITNFARKLAEKPVFKTRIKSDQVKLPEIAIGYFLAPFCAMFANAIFGAYLNRADTKAFFEREYPDLDYLAFHKRNHEIMNQLLADGMPVKTGAVELLHWLRQEEWRVALATSTGRESTMHHLEAAHMTDLFDAIITGEQVEHGKPDPEIYEMACDAIGATAGLSFAVEDSPNGIRSAAAANLRVIMVPDLVKPNLELRELVVTVQENLLGVQKFLEKFGEL